jgi:hypothetical protein
VLRTLSAGAAVAGPRRAEAAGVPTCLDADPGGPVDPARQTDRQTDPVNPGGPGRPRGSGRQTDKTDRPRESGRTRAAPWIRPDRQIDRPRESGRTQAAPWRGSRLEVKNSAA